MLKNLLKNRLKLDNNPRGGGREAWITKSNLVFLDMLLPPRQLTFLHQIHGGTLLEQIQFAMSV